MRASKATLPQLLLLSGLLAGLAPTPAPAAKAAQATPDCQVLLEFYRDCHRLGGQSGSVETCLEGAQDFTTRGEHHAGRRQPSRALMDLVCSTGCEDGAAGSPPATAQEFSEAFCDQAHTPKQQGGRP